MTEFARDQRDPKRPVTNRIRTRVRVIREGRVICPISTPTRPRSGWSRSMIWLARSGPARARYLRRCACSSAPVNSSGSPSPPSRRPITSTPFPPSWSPGSPATRTPSALIAAGIRWNAADHGALGPSGRAWAGGHISTAHAPSAAPCEVGFDHFFRGGSHPRRRYDQCVHPGPRLPASTPAPSWRAGRPRPARRLPPEHQPPGGGFPSYLPHPRLMPEFGSSGIRYRWASRSS